MPNWVENTLKVYGDEEYLKNFSEYVAAKGKSVFFLIKLFQCQKIQNLGKKTDGRDGTGGVLIIGEQNGTVLTLRLLKIKMV